MCDWIVHLLHEAGGKDYIMTSSAGFSALYLVVGQGQGFGVSVQLLHTGWERSALQQHTPFCCVSIISLFQGNGAALQQICWSCLHVSPWFGSQGSFDTHNLDSSEEALCCPVFTLRVVQMFSPGDQTRSYKWVGVGASAPEGPGPLLLWQTTCWCRQCFFQWILPMCCFYPDWDPFDGEDGRVLGGWHKSDRSRPQKSPSLEVSIMSDLY